MRKLFAVYIRGLQVAKRYLKDIDTITERNGIVPVLCQNESERVEDPYATIASLFQLHRIHGMAALAKKLTLALWGKKIRSTMKTKAMFGTWS